MCVIRKLVLKVGINQPMKLQKQLSRKVGKTEYAKWILVVPPKIIEELNWKEGQELEVEVKDNNLIVKK